MKMKFSKKIMLILMMVLIVPICWHTNEAVVNAAATPTFKETKVTIVGEGEVHQLVINNQVKGSTYKWSSSKTAVAKISTKGIVTSRSKGSSTIQCKITYPTKKTKTISCKVTVVVPAEDILINNEVEVNGAHIMLLGETFDFNCDIIPTTTSDKTYWTIGGGDASCITIMNETNGIVNATKAGKVILLATAAPNKEGVEKSIVNNAIIIEVVGPTATVKTVDIIDANKLQVVFDSPISSSTVIGTNNKLSENIVVSMRKDTKNVMANDPGNLTASLSTDLKTLTITAANSFSGEYGVNFSKNIKTTAGISIDEYFKQLTYTDNVTPSITGVVLDDTGMVATILFNEVIDFTNLQVTGATLAYTSSSLIAADPKTLSIIGNRLNYVASTDKKSLTIDLSSIAVADYGKTFTVALTGIKDMNGNSPAGYVLTPYISTDAAQKAQAIPMSVTRTSYNTITATFTRSISTPGYATVNNGASYLGVVDVNDKKKVNYTISDTDAILTGYQTVSLFWWSGYNVSPYDTTATSKEFTGVNFVIDRTSPTLVTYLFDPLTNILTLTYNKEVSVSSASGSFNSTLATAADEIRSNSAIYYTNQANTDKKVIKLLMSNMTLFGNYTFSLPQGFVTDSYKNNNISSTVMISNVGGTSGELPAPYSITQSASNPSLIYLEFANMLDLESAQTISNYSIPGVTILSVAVTKNTTDIGATVVITVADGTITATVERPIIISGVKGYKGSYAAMIGTPRTVLLKDNMKPTYLSVTFDKTTRNKIILNFSEPVSGTAKFKVTETYGSYSKEISNVVTTSGNTVILTLNEAPEANWYLRVDVLENLITDLGGNTSTLPTMIGVTAIY